MDRLLDRGQTPVTMMFADDIITIIIIGGESRNKAE